MCARVRHGPLVHDRWGFDRALAGNQGLVALFAGPPGTGKTMAAEIVANALALELYKIDLAHVVSKYIGETEKNLDSVFNAAERASAVLFFDEADALFGQRSAVRDAHDRYANIEVAYLLQKIEQYEGVVVLATNLAGNMDEAFLRRLAFRVEFPFPDEEQRAAIWRRVFPVATPLADDVDLDFMATQYRFVGGNIRNVALAAAFLAAAEGRPVGLGHLLQAVRREFQKMGKACSPADFGKYAALAAQAAQTTQAPGVRLPHGGAR